MWGGHAYCYFLLHSAGTRYLSRLLGIHRANCSFHMNILFTVSRSFTIPSLCSSREPLCRSAFTAYKAWIGEPAHCYFLMHLVFVLRKNILTIKFFKFFISLINTFQILFCGTEKRTSRVVCRELARFSGQHSLVVQWKVVLCRTVQLT